jgi:hypothetical protein
MKKPNITPGPWIRESGCLSRADMAEQLLDPMNTAWVAVGVQDEDGYAASVAYCHPLNAKAIAAVPELLAALEKIESELADIDLPLPAYAREALIKAGYEF